MEEKKNNNFSGAENNEQNTPKALSDESRVKVMSPSMLVFKRFVRNKLAVVGFVILVIMFLFSFVGPIFTPYKETQVFNYDELQFDTFAEYKQSDTLTFYNEPDSQMDIVTQTMSMSTINTMQTDFVQLPPTATATTTYYAKKLMAGVYELVSLNPVATYNRSIEDSFTRTTEIPVDDALYEWMVGKVKAGQTGMQGYMHLAADGYTYVTDNYIITETANTDLIGYPSLKSTVTLGTAKIEALATTLVFHEAKQNNLSMLSDADKVALIEVYAGVRTTSVGSYTTDPVSANGEMMVKSGGQDFVLIAPYILNPRNAGEFISIDRKMAFAAEAQKLQQTREETSELFFDKSEQEMQEEAEKAVKDAGDAAREAALQAALNAGTSEEEAKAQAEEAAAKAEEEARANPKEIKKTIEYHVVLNKEVYGQNRLPQYQIEKEATKRMIYLDAAPTSEHILGTDNFGMDVMTRLMYGGRVSLMVGFVVVFIELIIGVILGGLSGYFSGWVDVIIMRFIELFNCIPFYPMMLIIGAVLDANNVSADARIYLLMVLLGVLGWTGIARIVRGQILSLREQDFIVATEACGIPVSRRIFRHLIPNVVPLLIVNATMQLGGIIITEATLSFLGLGVKFPKASWGAMINQVQEQYAMRHFTWIWIPAGLLILTTVLGFNFVGDGLRDAFDPKMKR